MPFSLTPRWVFQHYSEITPDWLRQQGITLLLENAPPLYIRIEARAGADRACTAMLGDKLLTDMLAANRAGVLPLMVEPVGGAVTAWQKVLHALQAPFKAVCRRKMEKKS